MELVVQSAELVLQVMHPELQRNTKDVQQQVHAFELTAEYEMGHQHYSVAGQKMVRKYKMNPEVLQGHLHQASDYEMEEHLAGQS